MKCPECGRNNNDDAWRCDCGFDLQSYRRQKKLDVPKPNVNGKICNICGKKPETECNTKSIHELKLIDYKSRATSFLGLPTGGSYEVKGWKIKHNRTITTNVCDKCAEEDYAKREKKAPRNAVIAGIAALIYLILTVYFYDDLDRNYEWLLILLIFIGGPIFLGAALIAIGMAFSKKDLSYNILHSEALRSILGKIITLDMNPYKYFSPGAIFYYSDKDWKEWEPMIAKSEEKTGWSFIECTRKTSLNSMSIPDEQAAKALEVEHLGLFLEPISK